MAGRPTLQPIDSLRPIDSFREGPSGGLDSPGYSPGGGHYNGAPIIDEADGNTALPRLHLAAYQGDLSDVLLCITDGHDVHGVVVMRNQAGRLVCGITPLFLAAQKGHMKVVKLLVQHGANPGQPAYIQGSTDLCTPVNVARLNLHFWVAHYLKKAVAARKQEDKVLREEEEKVQSHIKAEDTPDPARGAQHVVMANLGDLTNWDPSKGEQPQLLNGQAMTLLMKHHVDLESWRPDVEVTKDGKEQMKISESRPVDPSELEALQITDNQSKLNTFLRDADLSAWTPDDGPAAARGAGAVVTVTSPAAATARSVPGDKTPSYSSPSVAVDVPVTSYSAGGVTPNGGMQRAVPLRPGPVQYTYHNSAGPDAVDLTGSPQQGNTPTASKAAAAQTRYAQAPRSSAAAAAAAMSVRRPARPAAPANRWVAHADSSDEEDDLEVSGSRPAAPPPEMALQA